MKKRYQYRAVEKWRKLSFRGWRIERRRRRWFWWGPWEIIDFLQNSIHPADNMGNKVSMLLKQWEMQDQTPPKIITHD